MLQWKKTTNLNSLKVSGNILNKNFSVCGGGREYNPKYKFIGNISLSDFDWDEIWLRLFTHANKIFKFSKWIVTLEYPYFFKHECVKINKQVNKIKQSLWMLLY